MSARLNRQVLLVRRPQGVPAAEDFAIVEAAIPEAPEGGFVVENLYLSVDPAMRGWTNAEANYSDPVPLDTPMRSLAVGRVVASRTPDVAEGEHLYGWFGWQDYAAATPDSILRRVDPGAAPLSASLGVLGLNGVTALIALRRLGRPVAGETIVVSTAAGGVGSIVGQLAREAGLRTVGLTGDDAKAALCRDEFGYDAAINYRTTPDLAGAIAAAAPGGIDIFFDNTGGAIADAVFPLMRLAGRVIQCGTASVASWTPPPQGPRREREVLTKRLSWAGFVIFDHMARFEAAATELQARVADGRLRYREQVLDGIEEAPGAIGRLYSGENVGRLVIKL